MSANIRGVPVIGINGGELGRRRAEKAVGGVDDAGPNRCRDARAADNVPIGGVIDPHTGGGVGDGGNVRGSPPGLHDRPKSRSGNWDGVRRGWGRRRPIAKPAPAGRHRLSSYG